jgi:hypothetical protein
MAKAAKKPKTSAERMAAYRARMRAAGYRTRAIWLPDWTAPDFVAEARRQARAAAQDPGEQEVMAWLDQVRDWPRD